MSLVIHQGLTEIVEPDGTRSDYERFLNTRNPDGSPRHAHRDALASGRSPARREPSGRARLAPDRSHGPPLFQGRGDGQRVAPHHPRKMHSWVWQGDSEMDYQIFDAPPKRTVGFHAIQHEAWKMNCIDRGQTDYQPLLAHTVSNTWNGRSLSHGTKLESKARYEGMESVTVPAGTFDCERFHWVNPFDEDLHIWCHGPERFAFKETVGRGSKAGTVYELADYEKKVVA